MAQRVHETKSVLSGRRRPGRPTRAAGPGDETRERLLQKATKLFARYGYEAVSTGDIAKAADVTQSMVHYYFGAKEKIWRAVVVALMMRRGPLFSPARFKRMDLDPIAKLEVLIRNLAAANAQEPDFARIVMQESISDSDRLEWLIDEYVRPGFAIFDEVIADAQAQGYIVSIPVHNVTNVVTSAVSLTYSLGPVISRLYDVDPTSEEYIDALTGSIIDILFKGLRPAT